MRREACINDTRSQALLFQTTYARTEVIGEYQEEVLHSYEYGLLGLLYSYSSMSKQFMDDRELLEVLELFDRNSGLHMCSKSQNGACL